MTVICSFLRDIAQVWDMHTCIVQLEQCNNAIKSIPKLWQHRFGKKIRVLTSKAHLHFFGTLQHLFCWGSPIIWLAFLLHLKWCLECVFCSGGLQIQVHWMTLQNTNRYPLSTMHCKVTPHICLHFMGLFMCDMEPSVSVNFAGITHVIGRQAGHMPLMGHVTWSPAPLTAHVHVLERPVFPCFCSLQEGFAFSYVYGNAICSSGGGRMHLTMNSGWSQKRLKLMSKVRQQGPKRMLLCIFYSCIFQCIFCFWGVVMYTRLSSTHIEV